MNEQVTLLRDLILKELDPAYFRLDKQQVEFWLAEIPLIKARLFMAMQDEVLGLTAHSLVERHLKQLQYDCRYLTNVLCNYAKTPDAAEELYISASACLDEIQEHIEERYAVFFSMQQSGQTNIAANERSSRIRVLFSVDTLAYFFKLLNKAGGLDAAPLTQLLIAISRNFITPGIGDGYISPNSLTTKYKQVVQTTARNVRTLLVKMLKHLDEEFEIKI